MHPLGITFLVVLLYLVTFGTRRWALFAMIVGVLYLTQGQAFEIFEVNFYAVRVLGVALFFRILVRREFSFSDLNRVDHAVLILYAYTTVVFLLRSADGQAGRIAETLDASFCYFGFRGLVKGEEDLRWLLRTLVVVLIPYVFLVGYERVTGNNPFFFMGGLYQGLFIRDDKIRCMGSFRYPVSLGTFAATFLALYIGFSHSKPDRKYGCMGIALCLWLGWASNSGGSFGAMIIALVAWVFWYLRKNMRLVRWGILGVLVTLAFVMKAPVWYILDRITFGGSSWHRAYLIDVALRNIDKWWFAGLPIEDTGGWLPYTLLATGGADITNQYLVFGLSAGIGSIALLVLFLSRAFAQIGIAMAKLKLQTGTRTSGFMLWGLGVMMAVHVVNWFGVSYFDQIYVVAFLQFAAVATITDEILKEPNQKFSEPVNPREFSGLYGRTREPVTAGMLTRS